MTDVPIGGVYLVTQASKSVDRSTSAVVEAAIRGGIDVVQLREKDTSARDRFQLGLELRQLTSDAGVPFIVNDRVDLAQALNADGVHVGEADLPVDVARDLLGPDVVIGRSVSTSDAAEQAEDAGADYLGVGSIFQTKSKDTNPDESEIGLDRLREIRAVTSIPIIGIGGITPENAGEVIQAGADGVAVISAITQADDPAKATGRLNTAVATGDDDT